MAELRPEGGGAVRGAGGWLRIGTAPLAAMTRGAPRSVSRALACAVVGVTAAFGVATATGGCASKKDADSPGSGRIEVARQFLDAGDYRRAVPYLQALARENPGSGEVHNLLGLGYLGLGNADAAAKSFAKVVRIDDDDQDAALNLSYALIVGGQHEKARTVLKGILDDGTYAYMERVHANAGLSWMEQGDCKAARREFDKALMLDPTFVTAHFNSGKCWLKSNQPAKAAVSFRKALDFCPGCVDPALELARAQAAAGSRKEAVEALEKMLRGRIDKAGADRTRKLINELKR